MKRILLPLVLTLSLGLPLSGCGNATAIDSRALAVGLAVDPAEGGQLRYTFQMPTPQSLGGGGSQSGGGAGFYYPSAKAKSFAEAISRVEDRTSRDVYLGQMQFVLISLKVPPHSRDRFLAELQRIGETDHTEWLAFAESDAAKLLPPPKGQEELPAVYYATHFDCRTCQSADMSVRFWRAIANLYGPSHATWIPVVSIKSGQTSIERIAAMSLGKPAVVLTEDETRIFLMLTGKTSKGVVDVASSLGNLSVRSLSVRAYRSADLVAGQLVLQDHLKITGQVARLPNTVIRLTPMARSVSEQAVAEAITADGLKVMSHLQRAGIDPLQFGDYLHLKDANVLHDPAGYQEAFRRARFHLDVSVQIPIQGTVV